MRYEYIFNVVDADGRKAEGACSFECDEPIAHLVRGAKIVLQLTNNLADHAVECWVMRVTLRPEITAYAVVKQVMHVEVTRA
ncbi:protein of unknown function [Pararobbsia alpina]|uniref:hypothetical protein n=1 Tax=Pararobbsia alpina TaxID=621374 RepID=UPI0039A6EE85